MCLASLARRPTALRIQQVNNKALLGWSAEYGEL